jgi:membrane-associated phospholipid phosphatase
MDTSFRRRFLISASGLIIALAGLGRFLNFIEKRSGVALPDPLLQQFRPLDMTWLIFLIIYVCLIIALIHLAREPHQLMLTLHAYILLVAVRIVSMFAVPFDPPPLLIPLTDPFVEFMSSGTLTRDLFFSGHTSTLFLLFLTARGRGLRIFFLICTSVVGVSVLIQHVHYSIDVLAAPFYSYTCYRLSTVLNQTG